MLLDTIKRHDTEKIVKFVCIESLKSVPPSVHSVPALLTMPDKKMMFGKSVFDFLLLPGTGKIFSSKPKSDTQQSNPRSQEAPGNPAAFTLGAGSADSFASFENEAETSSLTDRVYTWATVTEPTQTINTNIPIQEDTRTKKDLPDIDYIRQQRELDLRGEPLNQVSLPPPSVTRG
jgi:hypothetical protein